MQSRALIAGVTGLTGGSLAAHLVALGWEVFGLARQATTDLDGVKPLAADLLDPESLRRALAGVNPTHVFVTVWVRQATEAENCAVNGTLLSNLIAEVGGGDAPPHITLVTGARTYFGSFGEMGKHGVITPWREEQPRQPGPLFFSIQEDILFEQSRRLGFTWNVHRPPTIIGYALGNAMNMGVTLAVYASICRETGRPFAFPGAPESYQGIFEVVDVRILARQLAWAAVTLEARNQAFNISNGDLFRWNWMWDQLARYFEIEPAPYPGHPTPTVEEARRRLVQFAVLASIGSSSELVAI